MRRFWTLNLILYFDMQGCILDCAEMMDVVAKKGAWYSYGDHRFVSEVLILNEKPFFLQL